MPVWRLVSPVLTSAPRRSRGHVLVGQRQMVLDDTVLRVEHRQHGNPSNTPTGRVFLGVVASLALAAVVGVAMFVRRGMCRDAAEQLPADQIDSTLNARIDDELADA